MSKLFEVVPPSAPGRRVFRLVVVAVVLILLLAGNPIKVIPAGHVGVKDFFGSVSPNVLPPGVRFVLAVLLEATWEVFENTPFVIDRYRAATISLDYYGDSIVNSMSDIVSMMLGFWIARRVPLWLSVGLVIVLEVVVALIIRDNLTLNILMLIHPFEAIKRWQLAG